MMPLARWTLRLAAGLTAAFALYAVLGGEGAWLYGLFTRVVYNAVLLLAVLVIFLRALAVRRELSGGRPGRRRAGC